MTALADAEHGEHVEGAPRVSLIVGPKIRCPRCLNLASLLDYFVFGKPEEFEDQLNTVLKCKAKRTNPVTHKLEACRTVFSVADPLPAIELGDQNE